MKLREKMFIFGGEDVVTKELSTTPEMIDLKNIDQGWKLPEKNWCIDLTNLLCPSLTLLNDGIDQARPFFERPELDKEAAQQMKIDGAKEVIEILLSQLEKNPWDGLDSQEIKEIVDFTSKKAGFKKGLLMKSARAALLGSMQGPDLISTWGLLARIGEDRNRLRRCL